MLLPFADQYALLAISAVCHGSAAYYLGLLATSLERWPDAEHHFSMALAKHEQMAMRPYDAHTRFAWARMLQIRNDPADRERGLNLARKAATVAVELGMTRLEEQAGTLIGELESGERAAELTPREREVLGLVGQGLTDTEISSRLEISTRTVNAHMRSIFAKLDVPSRAAATRVAVERGLLVEDIDAHNEDARLPADL
ncbi:MAG: LuxR C-terminal-related transcriptional regulator [Thermomicrobiales bacterium]